MGKVVLVDKNDRVLGLMDKEGAHRKGELHRSVSVLLYRKKEGKIEVLLQQRRKDHPRWPLFWANTACTDLAEGEDYVVCGARRLEEEMGIKINLKELRLIYTFIYKARYNGRTGEYEHDGVVIGQWDGEVKLNEDEVENYEWKLWGKLKEEIGDRDKYAPWFRQMVKDIRLSELFKE